MTDQSSRVNQASFYVIHLQPGIAFQDRFRSVPCGMHSKNMFDGKVAAPDISLPASILGFAVILPGPAPPPLVCLNSPEWGQLET